jgi:ABC-type phosphate transport system substrate-binding protein
MHLHTQQDVSDTSSVASELSPRMSTQSNEMSEDHPQLVAVVDAKDVIVDVTNKENVPAAMKTETTTPKALLTKAKTPTQPGADATDEDIAAWRAYKAQQQAAMVCSLENRDECLACGS